MCEAVKELVHKNKALFIFDETITNFSYSLDDVQDFFNVIIDLATFGGETLSLASASAMIDKYKDKKIIEYFDGIGSYLLKEHNQLIEYEKLRDIFWTSGYLSWSFLDINGLKEFNKQAVL